MAFMRAPGLMGSVSVGYGWTGPRQNAAYTCPSNFDFSPKSVDRSQVEGASEERQYKVRSTSARNGSRYINRKIVVD